jgi:hypothetical protein
MPSTGSGKWPGSGKRVQWPEIPAAAGHFVAAQGVFVSAAHNDFYHCSVTPRMEPTNLLQFPYKP